ncbi:hypothetical protein GALL_538200 [mine drainage metagenome]|uniref:Uncharacterized protein n=1 Tax=mine drainage metagenome TaxID=410659 RepID=A0A1J5PAY9_9ZZZZ
MPAASARPSAAMVVSPAPEASNTSRGAVAKWRTGSPRTPSEMPLEARVTRIALASHRDRAWSMAAATSSSVWVGSPVA